MPRDDRRHLIGGEEWCALPDLGIPWVKSRVDSGARTSSLHAWKIHRFRRDGQDWVSFRIHPLQRDRRTVLECEALLVDQRGVKSSSGASEARYVIRTRLALAGESFPIEVTLTSRDSMGYRMLLGREAMQDRLIVDPSQSFLCEVPSTEELEDCYEAHRAPLPHLAVGILVHLHDDPLVERLHELAERHGHRLYLIDAGRCRIVFESHRETLVCMDVDETAHMDVVLSLLPRARAQAACVLLRHFEHLGAHAPNSARTLQESANRWSAFQRLARSGAPVPRSVWTPALSYGSREGIAEGVRVIARSASPGEAPRLLDAPPGPSADEPESSDRLHGVLLQDLPRSESTRLLRCYVAGTRVVAAPLRFDKSGALVAGKGRPGKLDRQTKRIMRRAMRSLGVELAAVDVMIDGDDVLVLDVDPFALSQVPSALTRRYADALMRHFERAVGGATRPSADHLTARQ